MFLIPRKNKASFLEKQITRCLDIYIFFYSQASRDSIGRSSKQNKMWVLQKDCVTLSSMQASQWRDLYSFLTIPQLQKGETKTYENEIRCTLKLFTSLKGYSHLKYLQFIHKYHPRTFTHLETVVHWLPIDGCHSLYKVQWRWDLFWELQKDIPWICSNCTRCEYPFNFCGISKQKHHFYEKCSCRLTMADVFL